MLPDQSADIDIGEDVAIVNEDGVGADEVGNVA